MMRLFPIAYAVLSASSAMALLLSSGTAHAVEIGEPFKVESDSGATYVLHSIKIVKGNVIEIVSQRDGSSGTSFAKRLVDCKAGTFRYVVSDADTLEEAMTGKSKGKMTPLVGGSISSIIAGTACYSQGLPKLGN